MKTEVKVVVLAAFAVMLFLGLLLGDHRSRARTDQQDVLIGTTEPGVRISTGSVAQQNAPSEVPTSGVAPGANNVFVSRPSAEAELPVVSPPAPAPVNVAMVEVEGGGLPSLTASSQTSAPRLTRGGDAAMPPPAPAPAPAPAAAPRAGRAAGVAATSGAERPTGTDVEIDPKNDKMHAVQPGETFRRI
nr:hypothetical protein [Phycisphaerales bacterium]